MGADVQDGPLRATEMLEDVVVCTDTYSSSTGSGVGGGNRGRSFRPLSFFPSSKKLSSSSTTQEARTIQQQSKQLESNTIP